MKKFAALALVLTLSLGGCENVRTVFLAASGFTVTQGQLDTARTAYDGGALAPAANYARLTLCAKAQVPTLAAPCKSHAIILSLRAADAKVRVLFDRVQAQIDAGNNSGITAAWDDLNAAIETAKGIITAFNIR